MEDTITISVTKTIELDVLTNHIIDEISEWVCDRYDVDDADDIPNYEFLKITSAVAEKLKELTEMDIR